MPLYEYYCELCGTEFESIRSLKDRDNAECPKCGEPAKRQISGFAVGSGGSQGGAYNSGYSSSTCSSGGG